MRSLEFLDFSNNNFSRVIPRSFKKLLYLKYRNRSFNRLEWEIPSRGSFANFSAKSFIENNFLCGSPNLQVPPCKDSKTYPHQEWRKNMFLLMILLPLTVKLIMIIISVILVLMRFYWKRSIRQTGELICHHKQNREDFYTKNFHKQ